MRGGPKVSVADVEPILTRLGIKIKTQKGLSIFKAPIVEFLTVERWRTLEQWEEYKSLGLTYLDEYKLYKKAKRILRKEIERIDKDAQNGK